MTIDASLLWGELGVLTLARWRFGRLVIVLHA